MPKKSKANKLSVSSEQMKRLGPDLEGHVNFAEGKSQTKHAGRKGGVSGIMGPGLEGHANQDKK